MSLARMVTWINIRQGWRTLLWAGILTATATLLDFVPLFDVLGYDFAFALGLVAALAGVDIGNGVVASARRSGKPSSPAILAAEAMLTALALLVLPLLVSLANAVRVRNCNLGAGLAFFALLPVCTAVYAAGAGAVVTTLVPARRLGRLAAFGLPLLSVAWTLVRLYRDPAVFAFDPFGGYFPGPIYDEALRPPLRLLWFRLANLTWLAAAIACTDWLCRNSTDRLRVALRPLGRLLQPLHRPAFVLALLAASLGWWYACGGLGIHPSHADLDRLLPRVTHTEHFVLRTDPVGDSDSDVARVVEDLEFRYHQLAGTLGVEPQGTIRVYRFPSAAAKKDAVGAANTLFAKPWTREIFVHADRFPAQRLRHELAHIFASAFGDPIFGVSMAWRFAGPIPLPHLASGLVEGIAEAADFDDPVGRSTTHEEAAAMLALGQAPQLGRALGAGFTFESGPRAYTVAGSFCRYLLDTFGVDKLRALYRSAGDFSTVYGRDLASLGKDWRTFLASLPVDKDTRAEAEESFRRPAIFHKVCARELAARVSQAHSLMSTAPGDAVSLLSSTCSDDPGEPTFRLDLAEAHLAAGEPEAALATLAELSSSGYLSAPLRGRRANLEAGVHFRAHHFDLARTSVKEALAVATEDGDERLAKVKLRALDDESTAATLGRVLFGDERGRPLDSALALYLLTEFARENEGEALGPYLVARQLAWRDPKLAVPLLDNACPFGETQQEVPLEPIFFKECRRLLGESAYLADDLWTARAAYAWVAANANHEADRLRAQDFLQRIAWKTAPPMLQPSGTSSGTNTPHERTQVPPR